MDAEDCVAGARRKAVNEGQVLNIIRWITKKNWRARRKQTTFCYCKNCDLELCSDERTTYTDENGIVTYHCGQCGAYQRFLFDAPVPIYLGEAS